MKGELSGQRLQMGRPRDEQVDADITPLSLLSTSNNNNNNNNDKAFISWSYERWWGRGRGEASSGLDQRTNSPTVSYLTSTHLQE